MRFISNQYFSRDVTYKKSDMEDLFRYVGQKVLRARGAWSMAKVQNWNYRENGGRDETSW